MSADRGYSNGRALDTHCAGIQIDPMCMLDIHAMIVKKQTTYDSLYVLFVHADCTAEWQAGNTEPLRTRRLQPPLPTWRPTAAFSQADVD